MNKLLEQETLTEGAPVTGDARAMRSRAKLRETLVRLIEEKPFEQVTIREITGQAKIGYATFFRHFPSKEALLNDLAADQISELTAMTLPMLGTDGPKVTSRALCAYVWEHRKIWAALLTGGAAGTLKLEFIRQMRQLAMAQTQFESWLPGDLRVAFAVAATLEILAWWLEERQPASVEQIADILDRLVVTPSLSDAPPVQVVETAQRRTLTTR